MKVGIDLSALQGAHRMRGIGSVLLNFINHLSDADKKEHSYVFFVLPESATKFDAFERLDVDDLNYEVRFLGAPRLINRRLPGRLSLLTSAVNQLIRLKELHFGDSSIGFSDLKDLDVYFQVDPGRPLPPKTHRLKRILMVHDLIPYALEWDYMWSYKTARLRGYSRKAAWRVQARRSLYRLQYLSTVKRADHLLANSLHTKEDFIRYFDISPDKITVTRLGVDLPTSTVTPTPPTVAYAHTSWGYLLESCSFDPNTPFLLFVGGADRRRKLEDLVCVFNHLRGEGQKLKLVLVGDTMQGPMTIATEETQHALRTSSYLSDIVFLGFADPSTLQWLYQNAAAFVFPSKYEGFGLPVLEAMAHGCPVVCYENQAAREVASDVPFYANDLHELKLAIVRSLGLNTPQRQNLAHAGQSQAKKFSWDKASVAVIKALIS